MGKKDKEEKRINWAGLIKSARDNEAQYLGAKEIRETAEILREIYEGSGQKVAEFERLEGRISGIKANLSTLDISMEEMKKQEIEYRGLLSDLEAKANEKKEYIERGHKKDVRELVKAATERKGELAKEYEETHRDLKTKSNLLDFDIKSRQETLDKINSAIEEAKKKFE